jgi:hypothetical protein
MNDFSAQMRPIRERTMATSDRLHESHDELGQGDVPPLDSLLEWAACPQ